MRLIPLFIFLVAACSGGDEGAGDQPTFVLEYCPDGPVWVAQQDGDRAWHRVVPSAPGTWPITISGNRGGIAVVYDFGRQYSMNIIRGSATELAGYAAFIRSFGCSEKTVYGTVTGAGEAEPVFVAVGATGNWMVEAGSPFPIYDVRGGTQSLLGARFSAQGDYLVANRVLRRDGLDVSDGGSIAPALDFASEGFAPVTATVSVTALNAGEVGHLYAGWIGPQAGFAPLTFAPLTPASAQAVHAALPVSQLRDADWQVLEVNVGNSNARRFAEVYFRAVVDRSIPLGPDLPVPTFSAASTTPYLRPRVQLPMQAEYDGYIQATFYQGNERTVDLVTTASYLGHPGAWDVSVPDLSSAFGWNPRWGLDPAQAYDWTVSASGGVLQLFSEEPSEGGTQLTAQIGQRSPAVVPSTASYRHHPPGTGR